MNFKYIPPIQCIECGKELKPLCDDTYGMVEGGVVGKISAPYGSRHDGTVYQIGICDDCIDKSPELVILGDYMLGMDAKALAAYEKEQDKRVEALRPTFEALRDAWKKETMLDSMHYPIRPSGLKIVAMGINDALPFIMEEMQKNPPTAWWCVILGELFKDKGIKFPDIPKESQGKFLDINNIWLRWLEDNGFKERKSDA
jgi:hypothetical protein